MGLRLNRKTLGEIAGVIFFGILGIYSLFTPTLTTNFRQVQGDFADAPLNGYFLEHTFRVASDFVSGNDKYIADYWSPTFYYPHLGTFAQSDNHLTTAPIYWLYRLFSSWHVAFSLWTITIAALTFLTTYGLMRYLQIKPLFAIFGAYLFAFGISRVSQIPQPQMLSLFYMPMSFMFMLQTVKSIDNSSATPKYLLNLNLFFMFWTLQAGANVYNGAFYLISLGFFVPLYLVLNNKFKLKIHQKHIKLFILTLLSWGMVNLILFERYIELSNLYGKRDWDPILEFMPTIQKWLTANPYSFLFQSLSTEYPPDRNATYQALFGNFTFLFVLTIPAIFVTKKTPYKVLIYSLYITGILLILISLKVEGFSAWYFLYKFIPGVGALAYISRIVSFVMFYLILATVLLLNELLTNKVSAKYNLLLFAMLLLMLLDQSSINKPSIDISEYRNRITSLQSQIPDDCEIIYMDIDTSQPQYKILDQQVLAMWVGMYAQKPTINRYSGLNYEYVLTNLSDAKISEILKGAPKQNFCRISE